MKTTFIKHFRSNNLESYDKTLFLTDNDVFYRLLQLSTFCSRDPLPVHYLRFILADRRETFDIYRFEY